MACNSRRLAAVGILALAPALGACGSGDSGHLSGTVVSGGGMYATFAPVEAEVTATPTGGDTSRTYTAKTAGDSSFELALPPGTYEVTATVVPDGGQAGPQEVTVSRGRTAAVKLASIHP